MRDSNSKGGDTGRGKGNGKEGVERSRSLMELDGKELNFRSIMKEVQLLGSSDMTWKERKDLQNPKIVSLGGKAPKRQRLPLSVARVMLKNRKERERKILQQELLCGHPVEKPVKNSNQQAEKRRSEDRVLKSSEGRFRNGVLDVKHLLKSAAPPWDDDRGPPPVSKGKKKKSGKNNHGRKKGGGRKRH